MKTITTFESNDRSSHRAPHSVLHELVISMDLQQRDGYRTVQKVPVDLLLASSLTNSIKLNAKLVFVVAENQQALFGPYGTETIETMRWCEAKIFF